MQDDDVSSDGSIEIMHGTGRIQNLAYVPLSTGPAPTGLPYQVAFAASHLPS
jgi:hypothetical protein